MLRLLGAGALGRGDHAAADMLLQESLASARSSGDKWNVAMTLNTCGDLARTEGDYERAGALYEESLTLLRERGVGGIHGGMLHNLGYVALHGGDERRAAALFAEALGLFRRVGDQRGMAECLAGLAGVFGARGQPERAARLFGVAEAAVEGLGTTLAAHNRTDYDRNVAAAQALTDQATFAAAWAEGRMMPLEQAAAYALDELGSA